MIGAFVYVTIAAAILVAGIRIGMLVAPRIGRWTDRQDEEPRDDGPS